MKYKDSKGRLVSVTNVDNNMATLNNGERVAVSRLNDTRYYTPMEENVNSSINENNNTNDSISADILDSGDTRYKNILENLTSNSNYEKKIGEEGYVDNNSNHGGQRWNMNSEVKMSNDVVERRNVPEQKNTPPPKPKQNVNQNSEEELLNKYNYPTPSPKKGQSDKLKELAYGKEAVENQETYTQKEEVKEENPVYKMFDKAKKVHPLKVDLKINEKIPSKDIIKMMEENFEESAIEYYAKDIFRKLMEDPSIIENQVKSSIEKYVNGNTTRKKKTTKKDDK